MNIITEFEDREKEKKELKRLALGYIQNFLDEASDLMDILENNNIDELKESVNDIKEVRSTMIRHLIIKNILCK